MTQEQFEKTLESRFSLLLDEIDWCVALLHKTIPFDEQWLVSVDGELAVGTLHELTWTTAVVHASDEIFTELSSLLHCYPETEQDMAIEVYGGAEFVTMIRRENAFCYYLARLPIDFDDALNNWCRRFFAAISKIGYTFDFANGAQHEQNSFSQDPTAEILNLKLPVRVRAAIVRSGATTLEKLRDANIAELAREVGWTIPELIEGLSPILGRDWGSKMRKM